jgi:hypothetical protein
MLQYIPGVLLRLRCKLGGCRVYLSCFFYNKPCAVVLDNKLEREYVFIVVFTTGVSSKCVCVLLLLDRFILSGL